MADLSGIPGAARIMTILHQLDADPGALRTVGATWSKAGAAAMSTGDLVASKAGALDGAWDGKGADSVVGYTTQLRTAFDAVDPVAKAVSAAVDSAIAALTAAKSAVEAITERVWAAVAALPATMNDIAGMREREAKVAAIVGPALGQAENALNTAVNALRDATGTITASCSTTPLQSLPPISEQAFQPAQFSAVSWKIHPVSVPGAPAPAPAHAVAQAASSFAPQEPSAPAPGGGGGGGDLGGGPPGGGGGGDLGGGPPGGGGKAAPAQVQQWIDEAIAILKAQGYPVDKMSREDIWTIIEHESGGNPQAINNWDSNAVKGTPSKGLMQTIGPTFASNALPGHGDIWNPVDNIIAGVRYSISRYGSVSNVPGVAGLRSGGGYQGY